MAQVGPSVTTTRRPAHRSAHQAQRLYGNYKGQRAPATKSWADEYGPGCAVNAVAPGPIATERMVEFGDAVNPVLARVPAELDGTAIDEVDGPSRWTARLQHPRR